MDIRWTLRNQVDLNISALLEGGEVCARLEVISCNRFIDTNELIWVEVQPLFELFDWQMAIYPDKDQLLGDQAYSHGMYLFVMTPKEGGNSI